MKLEAKVFLVEAIIFQLLKYVPIKVYPVVYHKTKQGKGRGKTKKTHAMHSLMLGGVLLNYLIILIFSCPSTAQQVTLSLAWSVGLLPLTIRLITSLQSDPRHLIRVMRTQDLTKNKPMTNTNRKTNTKAKTNTIKEHFQRKVLVTCDI